jgi:hypothetical protein
MSLRATCAASREPQSGANAKSVGYQRESGPYLVCDFAVLSRYEGTIDIRLASSLRQFYVVQSRARSVEVDSREVSNPSMPATVNLEAGNQHDPRA